MSLLKTLLVSIGLLAASLAQAEQPLTPKVIEQWLTSTDSIQQWFDSHEALQDDSPEEDDEGAFTLEYMIGELKAAGVYSEAENVVQKAGYDSLEQWGDIQLRIVKAVMSIEIEKGYASGEIQSHLDQIKNNPHISEEQKAMALNMIQSSIDMAKSMANASPADKAAVKPYIQQIQQKLDDEM